MYNILFWNNCNVLRTILSYNVNNHELSSFIEEELGHVIDMLKQDDVIQNFAYSLVIQYLDSASLNSCLCHNILNAINNINRKHYNNVYVELINSIQNIISIALNTIIPLNNSLYPNVNFNQIYNEYKNAQSQRKGELIQIKNFCRHLLFENDSYNLKLILSGKIMYDSIISMLGDPKVRKYIIELLVHNSQLRDDILNIVASTKLWYSCCLEFPFNCQVKSIRKNILYCIKHAELGMDSTFKEIYDTYNNDILKEHNVEKFFKYLFGGNSCDNLSYILYNSSFEDEWYYISNMLDKKEIKQSLISFLNENYKLHDRILQIVNRNDVCTSENYKNYIVNIQNKIRECVNESKKYEKYYNSNKEK